MHTTATVRVEGKCPVAPPKMQLVQTQFLRRVLSNASTTTKFPGGTHLNIMDACMQSQAAPHVAVCQGTST